MNCPKCGKEMLRGSMHTQKYPFCTQQELRVSQSADRPCRTGGRLDDDDTSVFTHDPFPEFPDAEICQECGLVVLPCKMIEKKAEK